MTLDSAYAERNYTVHGLRAAKGKRVLVETLVFDPEEASAAEEAGIDSLKVPFDPRNAEPSIALRQAAPHTFMAFSVPLTVAATPQDAVRVGLQAMEHGADAIMCQWCPSFVEAAAEVGIPVQGHAGLVPRKSTWTGGLRAMGKTADEALKIWHDIKDLENAGAYGVEVEVIPEALLAEISPRTSLVTASIGAGSAGDIQFLFADDILGNKPSPLPRHAKSYRDIHGMLAHVQEERIGGFREFIADVRSGGFPNPETVIAMDEDELMAFKEQLKL